MSPIALQPRAPRSAWPALPYSEWTDTLETLHLWTQIVGKVRTELSPWRNHSWSSALYVTPRGLTTTSIPHEGRIFEMSFDLVAHQLVMEVSDGSVATISLEPKSVRAFYAQVMERLETLGLEVSIHPVPNELETVVPFAEDDAHDAYDARHVEPLRRALVQADRVMRVFQAGFVGKVSPVHFFWGGFDLAVTRFSGREAPEHPGGFPNLPDEITREAYSHEVTSVGFWPGNRDNPEPIFYAYAYPAPDGFPDASVRPDEAFWLEELGEFALPYEAVRSAESPDDALLSFFESTHAAAAERADWARSALEWERGYRPVPRWSDA
ncbi:MAG: DUF5996 family protein [Longimicrobiales bacterium]|nr:DUF5996 family protein [Longimicrobiales bacterium]